MISTLPHKHDDSHFWHILLNLLPGLHDQFLLSLRQGGYGRGGLSGIRGGSVPRVLACLQISFPFWRGNVQSLSQCFLSPFLGINTTHIVLVLESFTIDTNLAFNPCTISLKTFSQLQLHAQHRRLLTTVSPVSKVRYQRGVKAPIFQNPVNKYDHQFILWFHNYSMRLVY